jgi:DNA integrity scanning protein DisA with diadenylate cyclase activity
MPENLAKFDVDFFKAAVAVAKRPDVHHIVWAMDVAVSEEILRARGIRTKLTVATTRDNLRGEYAVHGIPTVLLPDYPYSRHEKIQIAIGSGISQQIFKNGEIALFITGQYRSERADTIFKVKIGEEIDQRVSFEFLKSSSGIPAQVTEMLLNLAMEIGQHGKEGYPVGTILVAGDTVAVMEKSRQIVMNPFQGYSEAEKNVMDPQVREAIKSYATLDGAFVIRDDGVVVSAGRYLYPSGRDIKLPLGLGARHAAGAAITRETKALAIVVSQTSGAVRIFEGGEIIFELQSRPRMIG